MFQLLQSPKGGQQFCLLGFFGTSMDTSLGERGGDEVSSKVPWTHFLSICIL